MAQLPRWKLILCIVAVVYGVLFSLPNLLPDGVLKSMPGFLPHQRLNLGLDLRGGSYLLYEVDTAALKAERISNLTEDVRVVLQGKQIPFTELSQAGGVVSLRLTNAGQSDAALKELSNLGQPQPGAVSVAPST